VQSALAASVGVLTDPDTNYGSSGNLADGKRRQRIKRSGHDKRRTSTATTIGAALGAGRWASLCWSDVGGENKG